MNDHSLELAFAQWWQDSYGRPPGVHAVMTHVAFGRHLLELLELMAPEPTAPAEPSPSTGPTGQLEIPLPTP